MYYIYTEGAIDFETTFSKLGLTIRDLNNIEKDIFSKRYKELCSFKKKYNDCIKAYKNDRPNFRKLRDELESKDNIIDFLLHEWHFHEKKPVFHKSLNTLFDRIMIIDINEEKLKKFIEPEDFCVFISQFTSLSFIYDEKSDYKLNHDRPLVIPKRYNFTAEEELITKYLYNDCATPSAHLFISSKNLKKHCDIMYQFFSNFNAENIFRFIEIIEMYNMIKGFKPNLLINNVMIIESLIVKEDKNIAKDFIYKTALFLINGNTKYKLEECISILDYLYNIRSDIVHGNTAKLFNDYAILKEKLPHLDYPDTNRQSKMHKKIMIVEFSYILSDQILIDILKLWFSRPDELNFIKNI